MKHLIISLILVMFTPLSRAQGTHMEVGNLNGTRYADQFPSVQAAIDALPPSGGEVRVPAGTYAGPTNIPNNNTSIICTTWLGCTFTYSSSVTFGNGRKQLGNIRLDGIIFDFGANPAGLTLDGVQYSHFRIQIQNSTASLPAAALKLTASNASHTLTWENKFDWLNFLNVGTALVLNGDTNITGCGGRQSGQGAVFYNQFGYLNINDATADGIDFTSGVDSNDFGFVSIVLAAGNTNGHAVNFGTRCPSNYGDIVFEHFFTLSVNAVQAGYSGPFLQFNESEGAIDNFVCGTNCLGGATVLGYNPAALAAGNINWQIEYLAGNPYGQSSPVLQTATLLNNGAFFQIPLQTATSSANYPAPGIKWQSSEWNGSSRQASTWAFLPTFARSGAPTFENFNLINSGSVTGNLNFILQYPIRLGLQNASRFNTFFVANPAAASAGVTVTGPAATGTLSTGTICGTVATDGTCSNTIGKGFRSIAGIALLSGGTSTITGISPAFTSASSYYCVTNDITTIANPSKGVPATESSVTFTGTGTDQIQFICAGI